VRRNGGAAPAALLAAMVCLLLLASCGSTSSSAPDSGTDADSPTSTTSVADRVATTSSTLAALAPGAFDATDAALRSRVAAAGLRGATVVVVRAGVLVHEYSVGGVDRSTPMSVASSTKWLTAAALLTFVDTGAIDLDEPIGRWLPEFAPDRVSITARQLLIHTSGVRDQPCLWDGTALADCVRRVAASPREFAAGSAYSYGNADFHVLGRLIEELGGTDFAEVVRDRVTGPLGMNATTWPGAPGSPGPAAGVRTTVADYLQFLAMILGRGEVDGARILSERSVDELVENQLGGYDTSRDFAVGITRIPRYGLGCWPDEVDMTGRTVVVSGNGGKGFYPWVDVSTASYGVIGLQDDRGAQVAVPASQVVAVAARQALR